MSAQRTVDDIVSSFTDDDRVSHVVHSNGAIHVSFETGPGIGHKLSEDLLELGFAVRMASPSSVTFEEIDGTAEFVGGEKE